MKNSMLYNSTIYSEPEFLLKIGNGRRAEFFSAKHLKSSYASQQRNAKKKRNKRK